MYAITKISIAPLSIFVANIIALIILDEKVSPYLILSTLSVFVLGFALPLCHELYYYLQSNTPELINCEDRK